MVLFTACYDLHIAAGGKMVEFAGYQMPMQYTDGILREHLHTRSQAGLFDVSHMGQVTVEGANSVAELEAVLPIDVAALSIDQQCYAVLTNEAGGILDDLIITRLAADKFMLVVNAACKQADIRYLEQQLVSSAVVCQDQQALLALQGPLAAQVLQGLAPESAVLKFMHGAAMQVNGETCYVTRSGYTGEDGFEISIANQHVVSLANRLLESSVVKWVGLGARDSLRLEAGLCLYGHDIDSNSTVIEAGLGWSISRSRRANGDKAGGFPGADKLFSQPQNTVLRRRVGFTVDSRAPVREGAEVVDQNQQTIGVVTSGGFSPTLSAPIAMGYIDTDFAKPGYQVQALVRGKLRPMTVTTLPFVAQNYHR
ncbi:MAG: glycine cleavage system aminomethyltransferase GcvT [Pseudomonadota bacterium]|nr:glycine cleavage system aminomethyltransferase GcvT [Pseudomonadota bacterium]